MYRVYAEGLFLTLVKQLKFLSFSLAFLTVTRTPPDRIPFATQSDCVRVTMTFREVLQRDYLIFIVYKKAV